MSPRLVLKFMDSVEVKMVRVFYGWNFVGCVVLVDVFEVLVGGIYGVPIYGRWMFSYRM